jgi:hypothetical protein
MMFEVRIARSDGIVLGLLGASPHQRPIRRIASNPADVLGARDLLCRRGLVKLRMGHRRGALGR